MRSQAHWDGSRCESSRRAAPRGGPGWSACCGSGHPLRAGGFGRSATKPTTMVALALPIWMHLPWEAAPFRREIPVVNWSIGGNFPQP